MAADRGGIPHQNDTVSERQTSGRRSVPRLWRSFPRPRTWAPVASQVLQAIDAYAQAIQDSIPTLPPATAREA